jgi:hypothetical protein
MISAVIVGSGKEANHGFSDAIVEKSRSEEIKEIGS